MSDKGDHSCEPDRTGLEPDALTAVGEPTVCESYFEQVPMLPDNFMSAWL
ncbi:MAG: hypothetical protein JWN04_3152 [Myxococcaceae bacterium]|nr:hypothetical protein [Myxococcaceae bacterium]